jgi:hypothetical protein
VYELLVIARGYHDADAREDDAGEPALYRIESSVQIRLLDD